MGFLSLSLLGGGPLLELAVHMVERCINKVSLGYNDLGLVTTFHTFFHLCFFSLSVLLEDPEFQSFQGSLVPSSSLYLAQGLRTQSPILALHGAVQASCGVPKGSAVLALHLWVEDNRISKSAEITAAFKGNLRTYFAI